MLEAVTAVDGARVPGEQAPHAMGQGAGAGAQQEVELGGEERPGGPREGPRLGEPGEAAEELLGVRRVPEDPAPLDSPRPHVVQPPGASNRGPLGMAGA
jgi:hypothetical protein